MNETGNRDNQGEELQKLLDEVDGGREQNDQEEKQRNESDKETEREVDILNLPPRKDVHGNRNKRTKFKISHASGRFIAVIFVLILILGISFYLWGDELIDTINQI
ncbi:hypothetical protein [Lentibacillus sp.]|uniref:hypothetical protein n=1 Tax=Lentibacillus sp. TaxID=1925746 RepID=UPI002B4AB616|nr:hypothetical protein [Lentibacillus sp.]HLS08605.1 hypothetical protein [Lentibacillus sp.]